MSLVGIDHVQIAMPVGGEDQARAFYGGVLGLSEVPKPAELAGRGGCWFEHGSLRVHMGVEADFRPARKAHVGFLTDALEATLATARAAACETTAPESLAPHRRAFVFDPFGNRLELLQPA